MSDFECIELSNEDDVVVVKLIDEKVIDADRIRLLGQELLSLANDPDNRKVLINMEDVKFLSSSAINKLIVLDKRISSAGGRLKISNLSPEVEEVFNITQLNTVFDIRSDQSDAIGSFGKTD